MGISHLGKKAGGFQGELEEEDYHEIRKICDIKVKDWKIDKKLAFNKLGKTFKAIANIFPLLL